MFRKRLQLMCAGAVAALAALLIYHAVSLHLSGGLTQEAAAARLGSLALPGGAALLVLLAGCVLAPAAPARTRGNAPAAASPLPRVGLVRVLILGAALALIVLGVLNGGLWDVLVKAVNICTECIGLG